jgi:glucose/arabinose dehydrogenase
MPAPAVQSAATYTPEEDVAAQETESTQTAAATPTPRTVVSWQLETVVGDLWVPWSLVFTDTGRMLVSERSGSIREVIGGELQAEPLYEFTDIASQDEAGLMGMVLDPDYVQNDYLYACYSTTGSSGGLADRVVRLLDSDAGLLLDAVIMEDIPAARYHAGCRLGFGPDGKLYITTGDALQPQSAQSLDSLAGKILRINPDGTIPEDNPFPGSPVYSYGHRNPQGLAWQPESGLLYATEHGPSGNDGPGGGDEINLVQVGANYGWPLVSHDGTLEGTQSPLRQFTPAVAPASAMFYASDVLPMFTGNLFFGALRGEGLVRVVISPSDPAVIETVEWVVSDVGRVRDVVEGPDGYIYFTTSNRDGRGNARAGDDHIYRLVPVYE